MQSLSKSLLERGRFVGWLGWVLGKDSWIFQEVSKRCWLWIDQWTILWWYLQVNKMFLFSVNNLRKIVVFASQQENVILFSLHQIFDFYKISIKFKDSVQLKSEECRHVFFLVCKKRWSKFCIYCILLTVEQLKEYYCLRYKITHGFDFLFFFMVCRQFNVFKLHRLLVTSLHIGYELLNKPTRKIGIVETFFVLAKEQHYFSLVNGLLAILWFSIT